MLSIDILRWRHWLFKYHRSKFVYVWNSLFVIDVDEYTMLMKIIKNNLNKKLFYYWSVNKYIV